MSRRSASLVGLVLALVCAAPGSSAAASEPRHSFVPPDPYRLLDVRLAEAPLLDPVPVCVPGGDALGSVRAAAAARSFELALARVDALRAERIDAEPHEESEEEETDAAIESGEETGDLPLTRAVLRARLRAPGTPNGDGALELARALEQAIRAGGSAEAVACAHLELARLRLAIGWAPDAGLSARRAALAFAPEDPPPAIRLASLFYRAEALYREDRREEATALYEELAGGLDGKVDEKLDGKPPLVRAARLRLADIAYVADRRPEDLDAIEEILSLPTGLGTSRPAWGPRLAEWALAQRDGPGALAWLTRVEAEAGSAAAAAVEIRRADLLYVLGSPSESEALLEGVTGGGRDTRQLALTRLLDWNRGLGGLDNRLDEAARSENRRIASYAHGVRASRLVAQGNLTRALDDLVWLIHDGAERWLIPEFQTDLDRVLSRLEESDDCDRLVSAVAGRRSLLMRHAGQLEPFLMLGDCYLDLGMATAALDTYRGAAKAFGPDAVKEIALRLARAELSSGRTARARATAAAGVARGSGEDAEKGEWRLLHAETLLEDGRGGEALGVLRALFADAASAQRSGAAALRSLELATQAARQSAPDAPLRKELGAAVLRVPVTPQNAERVGRIALAIADLHRDARELTDARRLYRGAAAALGPGPLESRATYWFGLLTENPASARKIWSRLSGADDEWARLARNETRARPKGVGARRLADLASTRSGSRASNASSEGESE